MGGVGGRLWLNCKIKFKTLKIKIKCQTKKTEWTKANLMFSVRNPYINTFTVRMWNYGKLYCKGEIDNFKKKCFN